MDLTTALTRMEEMLHLMDDYLADQGSFGQDRWDRITQLYGEVEEVIHRVDGTQVIKVESQGTSHTVHKDFVSAGWLSGRTFYLGDGRTQLVKVIAKLRAIIVDPGMPETPTSIDQLLRALRRFRECCQFIEAPPKNERQVQDIIWIMLRAQFDRIDREATLPRFGVKGYKPDFGIPDLRTLVEVKFDGPKTDPSAILEEALADVPCYLKTNTSYVSLVVFVYDAAHKLLDSRRFVEDLRTVGGIVDVIVVPGITRME